MEGCHISQPIGFLASHDQRGMAQETPALENAVCRCVKQLGAIVEHQLFDVTERNRDSWTTNSECDSPFGGTRADLRSFQRGAKEFARHLRCVCMNHIAIYAFAVYTNSGHTLAASIST